MKVHLGKFTLVDIVLQKTSCLKQNTDMPTFLLHESKILEHYKHIKIYQKLYGVAITHKPTLIMELLTTSFQN